jgi:hypothetical protein
MATWVPFKRACKFPNILKVYKKGGRLQETPNANGLVAFTNSGVLLSAQKSFAQTVRIFFQGETAASPSTPNLPAWIRKSPLSNSNDWQDCQVDVNAIPGVRPLRKDGTWTGTNE